MRSPLAAVSGAIDDARTELARRKAGRAIGAMSILGDAAYSGTVLVDAMWDNPNYWIRYGLLRRALGLHRASEVGVTGQWRARRCEASLRTMGVRRVVSMSEIAKRGSDPSAEVDRFVRAVRDGGDLLELAQDAGFPADGLHDGILKKQRAATVDAMDEGFPALLEDFMRKNRAATELLDREKPSLLVLSHVINFAHAPLAFQALQRGIPVLLLIGYYEVPRFVKFDAPEQLSDWMDRPKRADYEGLRPEVGDRLAETGVAYLEKRRRGETSDIGADYAYRRRPDRVDRASLVESFGWDGGKPVVAVYASNWFDYPRLYGMRNYREFLDWLHLTVDVARRTTTVNWLFKAHPCDEWYGGVTLSDLMPDLTESPHIRQASKTWNGGALMDAVDALVTVHGTAGVEFSACGKPVLLADRGWYDDMGFARVAESRADYVRLLESRWWEGAVSDDTRRRARIFAGWYFARPAWQQRFLLQDDSVQWPIFNTVPELLEGAADEIERETALIREWFYSDHRFYHTWKMSQADEFTF